jgi:hypothetical protein
VRLRTSLDGRTKSSVDGRPRQDRSRRPAPSIANASSPTAAELRRLAIWSNYRALVDMSTNGGYGRFWGPNNDPDGDDTLGEGKIPGFDTHFIPVHYYYLQALNLMWHHLQDGTPLPPSQVIRTVPH